MCEVHVRVATKAHDRDDQLVSQHRDGTCMHLRASNATHAVRRVTVYRDVTLTVQLHRLEGGGQACEHILRLRPARNLLTHDGSSNAGTVCWSAGVIRDAQPVFTVPRTTQTTTTPSTASTSPPHTHTRTGRTSEPVPSRWRPDRCLRHRPPRRSHPMCPLAAQPGHSSSTNTTMRFHDEVYIVVHTCTWITYTHTCDGPDMRLDQKQ